MREQLVLGLDEVHSNLAARFFGVAAVNRFVDWGYESRWCAAAVVRRVAIC